VVFRPAADRDLTEIYLYIAEQSGDEIALKVIERLRSKCLDLSDYSERGTPRYSIVPGLRILVFERWAIIAYRVEEESVVILNVFRKGRDWEALLRDGAPKT
jgi:toxin ParE1/3/4